MSLGEEENSGQPSQNKVKWVKHYSSDHRILLVGDGDFSFSLSLGMAFGDASNIVATSLDSYDVVIKKYKEAKTNLEDLHSLGAEVLHEVDALQMKLHRDLQMQKFDRIIFNFPHAGFLGCEDDQRIIMKHRNLVCGFFKNASGMLLSMGEVHVAHKTSNPYESWNLEELATQNSLTLLERIEFKLGDYPGYNNKRGDGNRADEPFPLGECSTYKFVLFSKRKKVKWVKHYSSDHRILLVGEGDFSFSVSLARAFGDASNIVATSLESYDVVIKKYKEAKTNLENLRSLGAEVLHEVDALQMELHRYLQKHKFDRIIFNFPHAGFLGREDDQRVIMKHRNLVCGFFKNASGMLRPKGEVHVAHKTSLPFSSWNIKELATQNSLKLLCCIEFKLEDYSGYNNKRGGGERADEPFPLGECSTYKFVLAAADQTVLQFFPLSTSLSAKVHPLVIFNICDCVVRRPDEAERAIGTLLGSVLPDGTFDIRNSYIVPHNESSDQVALDTEYHHNMLSSHQKVNPKEVIVGWFSTGFGVTGSSVLIHDFYSREVPDPVHLTVDTGFTNGEASIKAFVSANLSLGDQQLAAQFQEIPLDFRMVEAERVGFDVLKTTAVDKLPTDMEGMEATMERLLALIDDTYKYVDDVVEGHVTPDNNIGRFISDTVSSISKISPSSFNKLVNDSLQDQLLLLYLSSITRTQLSLAEKLNTAAQIL